MPQLRIHWKGCPHHRLPRIRLPSTPLHAAHLSSRREAHLAAREVHQLPLGAPLDKARERERLRTQKRTKRRYPQEFRYSVMQVTDIPAGNNGDAEMVEAKSEYAHIGPLESVGNAHLRNRPPLSSHPPTYDTRLPIRNPRPIQSASRLPVRVPGMDIGKVQKITISTSSSSGKEGTTKQSSNPSTAIPSRTSSQKKALRHFTRGIKKHLIAAEAIRKASLSTSTQTSSHVSAHTIVEFMPYLSEFQAAGLAVTSKDQLKKPSRKVKTPKTSLLPPETTSLHQSLDGTGGREPEKYEPQDRCDTCDTVISNETVIGLTPIGHVMAHTGEIVTAAKAPIRKALPWLRKQNASPSPSKQASPAVVIDSPSSDTDQTTATTIIDFDMTSPVLVRPLPDSDWLRSEPSKPLVPDAKSLLPLTLRPTTPLRSPKREATAEDTDPRKNPSPIIPPSPSAPPAKALPETPKPKHDPDHINCDPSSPSNCLPSRRSSERMPRITTSELGIQDDRSTFEQALDKVLRNYHPADEPFISISEPILETQDAATSRDISLKKRPTSSMRPLYSNSRSSTSSASTIKEANVPAKDDTKSKSKVTSSTNTPPSASLSSSSSYNTAEIKDRDVLRGLQVAVAAASDPEIDAMIRELAGCSVRRFLADLTVFDGLGVNALADAAKRTAIRRKKRLQALKEVQSLRLQKGEADRMEKKDGSVEGKGETGEEKKK